MVDVPATGSGSYHRAGLDIDAATTTGRLIRYDVQVEKNLDLEADEAAELIEEVLNDKRSWRGSGRWRFELVGSARRPTCTPTSSRRAPPTSCAARC